MMNPLLYLILWLVFVTMVYCYLFYDIHATEINLREKWQRLYYAFTEEE